jgi:hypothetical protein
MAIPLQKLFLGDMGRLNFALSLETTDPKLVKAINDERDRSAVELAKQKTTQSTDGRKNGRVLKKKGVTKAKLETFRENFIIQHGQERGWKKAAALEFDVTPNTIRARLK